MCQDPRQVKRSRTVHDVLRALDEIVAPWWVLGIKVLGVFRSLLLQNVLRQLDDSISLDGFLIFETPRSYGFQPMEDVAVTNINTYRGPQPDSTPSSKAWNTKRTCHTHDEDMKVFTDVFVQLTAVADFLPFAFLPQSPSHAAQHPHRNMASCHLPRSKRICHSRCIGFVAMIMMPSPRSYRNMRRCSVSC